MSSYHRKSNSKARRGSKKNGQSIVEVLIATVIVGTVLTAIAAGLTLSIKNTAQTRIRSLATNLAQEGIEIFRRERQLLGWTEFEENVIPGDYCLATLPSNLEELANREGECGPNDTIAGSPQLVRQATITSPNADTLEVQITVQWTEKDDLKSVSVRQDFRNWSN